MSLVSFYRVLRFAAQSFYRNFWLSAVTITIIVLSLFSLDLLYLFKLISNQALLAVQEKIDISIYLKPDADEIQVAKLEKDLKALPEVKSIESLSPAEALARFKEENKDNPTLQEALAELEENPLGATLAVKARSNEEYQKIIELLNQEKYQTIIESQQIQDYEKIINKVNQISSQGRQFGLVISGVFIIIALLVAINTIRIAIYTHRNEIQIMKLVGATNWFIQAPFLIEGVIIALIAVMVTTILFFPLVKALTPYLNNFFAGFAQLDLFNYFSQNWLYYILAQVGIAVIICVFSTAWAIRRYLRV